MLSDLRLLAISLVAAVPVTASASWQLISDEPGRRIELDRASIKKVEKGKTEAHGRIVLDKPIVDPRTSSSYRIVEAVNRYDCATRSYSTLQRRYFKDEGELLREEAVRVQIEMPVRTGMLDDKLLREVCRPKPGNDALMAAKKTAEKVSAAAGELRKANEALVRKEVRRANLRTQDEERIELEDARPPARQSTSNAARRPAMHAAARQAQRQPASLPTDSQEEDLFAAYAQAQIPWSYEGEGRPENWGKLRPDYATCADGERQSPIDIRDGFRVDLEPIRFTYRPSQFRVIDNGHTIQVDVGGSHIGLLGKTYDLIQFHFHRPSEERIDGQSFDMVMHLVHKSEDGDLAVVALLLEQGMENPLIQSVWNNLPLEKNEYVQPPDQGIDLASLIPEDRSYYTYMGSLTTPPCTEDVLWLVLKQTQQLSPEQLRIFSRLYPYNARPVQPKHSRMIKESR
ncbi:MAG: Carbonic anhydrase precursor [Candidatus Accumulibacter appositus]|uniref:carbonic anhydrase n=1 Tax=Candidatus Accumulibacter appositus TaxID=1454003 RepID=A0A011NAQ1_9PROT|nr:carbonic anhydrase family protein [Accumulibacter sp.]EXI79738.1 MAG: Carbonic anhydrase precursor [Candidatus Accumulibacter appositus]HRF05204.1 carbonic anhydrase family protein [Accumulibacter sp.]